MNRIFCITVLVIFLSGCPATFKGVIKNESDNKIAVLHPIKTEYSWIIDTGSEEKVNWYQQCIILKTVKEIQYFSGWPIPKDVVTNHMFSSSLKAVYKGNELFFKSKSGQLIKIKKLTACGRT
jgi:hypothetical protein